MTDQEPPPASDPADDRTSSSTGEQAPRRGASVDRPADARHLLGSFIGMIGMASVLFLVLASGLVAPGWAVAALAVVWLVLFVVGTRWFLHHPWRVAALPVVMVLIWLATVSAGATILDWNA